MPCPIFFNLKAVLLEIQTCSWNNKNSIFVVVYLDQICVVVYLDQITVYGSIPKIINMAVDSNCLAGSYLRVCAFNSFLGGFCRKELILQYSRLSEEATRRERRAMWRAQRSRLDNARAQFFTRDRQQTQV